MIVVEKVYAEDIEPGDTIEWAGRRVNVGVVEHGHERQQGSVWLTIGHADLGEPLRCHYRADEIVKRVLEPERAGDS